MTILPLLAKFSSKFLKILDKNINHQERSQEIIFKSLIASGKKTLFGKEHNFKNVNSYKDFIDQVPIQNYESLFPYINRIKFLEKDILWPGLPKYFATTSGTTSGSKYIPITNISIKEHIYASQKVLLHYIANSKSADFLKGQMLFLSGSPILEGKGILEGRLSGIVNHHIPSFLMPHYLPTMSTNSISQWNEKVDKIILECLKGNLTLISGIPPWVQMFFDRALEISGKKFICDAFPNLQVYIYGGVMFSPYKQKMVETIGKNIDFLETYPASEGFIAYSDTLNGENGMLLNCCGGMFFEFIEQNSANSLPVVLKDVELNTNYSVLISSNAGLWRYDLCDTIKFVSKKPYRIVVTGRTSHYISAFGEHVIAEEIESALDYACKNFREVSIKEYTVAPNMDGCPPYHEWFIEFESEPQNMSGFASAIDLKMTILNKYYSDLIKDGVIQKLKIRKVTHDAFRKYQEKTGKLGGQNKTVHLSNDRNIVEMLQLENLLVD